MKKTKLIPAALALCAALAALAAPAQADFRVGMGDQDPAMFDNPDFQSLKVKRVRYLVPYDWFKLQGNEDEVTAFMDRAQRAGVDILVHFTARRGCFDNGVYSRSSACRAPSVATYTKNFKRFRSEYPFVKTFGAWNEGNHVSQPTAKNPKLAARYFLAARSACRSCTIVAADVLDSSNMESWLRGFDRYDQNKAKIWGLHNYADVNRKRSSGTQRLLARVPGEVWLTETGGILSFRPSFPRSESRQASRTRYMFSLADKYDSRRRGLRSRVTRLYNYQWTGVPRGARFDAGLVNPDGTPRKAFATFKTLAARHAR